MKPKEFVRICVLCGYASKKAAEEYSKDKTNLTEDDLMEVFRLNERRNDISHGVLSIRPEGNGDYLLESLNRKPIPWKKDLDLNRGLREDWSE